ncbi:MAG TPA: response regulator transcription factor [Acidimicrobiia bacterium]|nr:response regulator transcription factor [Acidimicrobiia bacterium]
MKILVVEDEMKLARAIMTGLELEGWVTENATNSDDAHLFLKDNDFDAVILDRMLDDGTDGIDICRAMRAKGNTTPVLMLTARNETRDRIDGLDIGADDYLGKPFEFDELSARIRAIVRRPTQTIGPIVTHGMLTIDMSRKEVSNFGKVVSLSKKEYSLLEYLLINQGMTISKDQIIERVWDFDSNILPNTVEATIKNIRKKLKSDVTKSENLIETVRGFGYRIAAQESAL